jgi:hypothetical protein
MSDDTILVRASDDIIVRDGEGITELKVEVLAENVNLFLTQVETILQKAPDQVGNFHFTEFSVSAEVSADGKLVLFGSGVETGIKGGLTFKFEKKG